MRDGFRILGPISGERRPVNARAALAGYATCDPRAEVEREAYLSAFDYGQEFREYLARNGSVRGFPGPCGAAYLWWDVDRDGRPDVALRDARALALYLIDRYALREDEILIFFSGGKGYHVLVPTALWRPEPSMLFDRAARALALALAAQVPGGGVGIDSGVYSVVQAFRAPNSRHPRTGLHKRLLSVDQLIGLSPDAIVALARSPEPFDLPAPDRVCERALADWTDAVSEAACEDQAVKERRAAEAASGGPDRLNVLTLEFIKNGAPVGGPGAAPEAGRHRRLFAAAVNLSEFGCPPRLAHALLAPAALDSGLAPCDAAQQIDKGLKFKERGHG